MQNNRQARVQTLRAAGEDGDEDAQVCMWPLDHSTSCTCLKVSVSNGLVGQKETAVHATP